MNWLFLLLLLVLVYYFWHRHSHKKAQIRRQADLLTRWGYPKEEDFDLIKIKRYKDSVQREQPPYQALGAQENTDLNLDEVFMYLDRTITPIGQQYLYDKLHTIPHPNPAHLPSSSVALEDEFARSPSFRKKIYDALQPLNTPETHYFHFLFTHPMPAQAASFHLACTLTLLHLLAFVGLWFYPLISLLFILTLPLNLFIHYKNKVRLYAYQNGITQLRKIRHALTELRKTPLLHPFIPNKTQLRSLHQLTRLTTGFTPTHSNEISTLLWFPLELIKITLNIESLLFHLFTKKLEASAPALQEAFTTIGAIEVALSNASCQAHTITCRPVYHAEKRLHLVGINHPLVVPCVPNNLDLNQESLLLTGSNMSGKTTFIRTVALNILLSQTLGFAFAQSFHHPFCRLHTSIQITDDILQQTSYYLREVETIKHFLDQCATSDFNLFVLDELLKGTNTTERIAGSAAILRYLNQSNNLVLVSTHDLELVHFLASASYAPHYFSELFDSDNRLQFDYLIKKGVPTTTNALRLLQLYHYPETLVAEALHLKQLLLKQKKE